MGIFYKKCDFCGNRINKLRHLAKFGFNNEIECKKCGLKYEISNAKFCEFTSNILQAFYALICLFCSIGLSIYVADIFDIHWLVSVLVFAVAWFALSIFCFLLEWAILLLFVAKFKAIKDDKKEKISIFGDLINGAFNIFKKK